MMGMFDSLIDERGDEWQTKAYRCHLDEYRVGDTMPEASCESYQVDILGGPGSINRHSLATVRDGVLVAIDQARDLNLPFMHYFGGVIYGERETP